MAIFVGSERKTNHGEDVSLQGQILIHFLGAMERGQKLKSDMISLLRTLSDIQTDFILSLYLVHRVVKHFIPDIIPRILKKGAARTLIIKEAVIYTLPLSIVLTVLIFLAYPAVSMYIDHTTCSDFVGTVDADGCILLKVNKASVGSDPMLLKSGVTITALKHIDGTTNALVQKGIRTV